MSGIGKRFCDAGYTVPKPLIMVDGRPIISYVIDMFPGETDFLFICNREHLEMTPLRSVLENCKPGGRVLAIESHKKGPVYAVSQCFDQIDDEGEVIVNYCDFYSDWDYAAFLNDTRTRKAAGCVPSYRGFHPHMLGTDNYAFIRDEDRWLKAIQEKQPFTSDRMAEYASNGTYYFSQGRHVKRYFAELMEQNVQVNGEFYVSMIYNLMVRDGLPVSVYEVPHMLQWGTPKDLEEYQKWSDYFRSVSVAEKPHASEAGEGRDTTVLLPMAGHGSRFSAAGYSTPKPLIEVSGKPMVVQATDSLPPAGRYVFVALKGHLESSNIEEALKLSYPGCSIVALDHVTEGQACTCAFGVENADPPIDLGKPLIIGACDNGMGYDREAFRALTLNENVDAVAFTFRNHPASKRNPKAYGWIKTARSLEPVSQSLNPVSQSFSPANLAENGADCIAGVSVKVPISETPENDHAIVGSFWFRKAHYLLDGLKRLQERNVRVNNEFYVDSLIGELVEMGLDCRVFEIDYYVCWGTPDDLKVFQYWQEFFNECPWHPYRKELDPTFGEAEACQKKQIQVK
jgi:NDP-sugar pyrophosphorylase family protein